MLSLSRAWLGLLDLTSNVQARRSVSMCMSEVSACLSAYCSMLSIELQLLSRLTPLTLWSCEGSYTRS